LSSLLLVAGQAVMKPSGNYLPDVQGLCTWPQVHPCTSFASRRFTGWTRAQGGNACPHWPPSL